MPDSDKALVVFTYKSVDTILGEGGTSSWHVKRDRARTCEFVVCTRNANSKHGHEGRETHGSAFMIGRIKDVVPTPEHIDTRKARFLIQISEFARIDIPGAWRGDRIPTRYSSLKVLGIDPAKLMWQNMPARSDVSTSRRPRKSQTLSQAISEARGNIARVAGLKPEAVEITIRA
jgi:hypothetical protein